MNDLESRAIRAIAEKYPITMEELSKELKLSRKRTDLLIKRLELRGIVIREPLPDKVYLRLV